MKKSILSYSIIALQLFFFASVYPQNYTWVRGLSTGTTLGVYGTQGVAAPGNDPGSRHGAATWTDAQGNMWMFGGEGLVNTPNPTWYSDLWKYDPTTNQWTWIKGPPTTNNPGTYGTQGVANAANNPGAREFAMSWIDTQGNFWLYGGDGFAATYLAPPVNKLCDLWKYNPVTNQWTWMKGTNTINDNGVYGTLNVAAPGNYPGGRYWGGSWVDNSGNFWLFGGRGFGASAQGRLNDLWKYSTLTNQWTWVGGSQAPGATGVFGTQSVPSAGNYPGARETPGYCTTSTGKLILFGGQGYGASSSIGRLNDLWEYNISTGMWTWITGSTAINSLGIYGTPGISAPSTMPGSRYSPACWADANGNYWLFGGDGFPSSGTLAYLLNDLFKYNPAINEWTWMKGSSAVFQPGTYGTQGLAATPNTPGARNFPVWWSNTSNGYLWLFGGLGLSANTGTEESTNDLWKFRLPCNPDSVKTLPVSTICSGYNVALYAYNQFPSPVSWYTSSTGGTAVGTGSFFTSPSLTATGGNSVYTFYAEANSCTSTPRPAITVTVLPLPPVSITGPTSVCPGETATVTASGAQTYTWNTQSTSSTFTYTGANSGTTYTVMGKGLNGCVNFAAFTAGQYGSPTITATSPRPTICRNESVILTASGGNTYLWNGATNSTSIAVSPTVTTTYTVFGTDVNGCSKTFTMNQFVAICLGVADQHSDSELVSIYPNPANAAFMILAGTDAKLLIANQLGAIVFEKMLYPGENVIESGLGKGVYFYSVYSANARAVTGKIIME